MQTTGREFRAAVAACVLLGGSVLTGCANAIDCALTGDNLRGRVTFGADVTLRADVNVVVQYSTDSFATSPGTAATRSNPQGLLTVPYSMCAAVGTYQLRAFEDLNGNGSLDAGEPSGRLDGTATGHDSFANRTISALEEGGTNDVTDADIVIDTAS